jgi:hypothetical protein
MKTTRTILCSLLAIVVGCHLRSTPKEQVSKEDAYDWIQEQSKINTISTIFQKKVADLQKEAEVEAAPHVAKRNEITTKICKANGFPPDCTIDFDKRVVTPKAPAAPAKP